MLTILGKVDKVGKEKVRIKCASRLKKMQKIARNLQKLTEMRAF
jgi:hypothetical protein